MKDQYLISTVHVFCNDLIPIKLLESKNVNKVMGLPLPVLVTTGKIPLHM